MSINYPKLIFPLPPIEAPSFPSSYRLNQTRKSQNGKKKTTEANCFPSSWLIGNFLFLCRFLFCLLLIAFITNTTTIFKPPLLPSENHHKLISSLHSQFTMKSVIEFFLSFAFHARENGERFKIDPNYLDTEIEFGYA